MKMKPAELAREADVTKGAVSNAIRRGLLPSPIDGFLDGDDIRVSAYIQSKNDQRRTGKKVIAKNNRRAAAAPSRTNGDALFDWELVDLLERAETDPHEGLNDEERLARVTVLLPDENETFTVSELTMTQARSAVRGYLRQTRAYIAAVPLVLEWPEGDEDLESSLRAYFFEFLPPFFDRSWAVAINQATETMSLDENRLAVGRIPETFATDLEHDRFAFVAAYYQLLPHLESVPAELRGRVINLFLADFFETGPID